LLDVNQSEVQDDFIVKLYLKSFIYNASEPPPPPVNSQRWGRGALMNCTYTPVFPLESQNFLEFNGISWNFKNCYFQAIVLFQVRNIHCKLELGVVACESVVHVHVSSHNVRISRNIQEFFNFPKITRKRSGFPGIQEISFEVETLIYIKY